VIEALPLEVFKPLPGLRIQFPSGLALPSLLLLSSSFLLLHYACVLLLLSYDPMGYGLDPFDSFCAYKGKHYYDVNSF